MTNKRSRNDPYTGETIPMPAHSRPQREQQDHRNAPRRAPGGVRPPLQPPRRTAAPSARWLRRIMLLLIAVLVVACVGTFLFQQRIARQVALQDVRQNRPAPNILVRPMNILLLGVDLRPDHPEEGVRSDTLILLHLDPASGWGSLLSIPRDTYVTIPDLGEGKINAAFGHGYNNAEALFGAGTSNMAGGAALATDTVEQFLGLRGLGTRIDYVATINFDGFAKMIDAVGGVDVDVPFEIVDTEYPTEDFGTMTITFPAGPQHLDGTRTLQYVRTRHADSDFGRAERQQQVIRALVQALREQPLLLRPITALRLVDAAGAATRTTVPVSRPDALIMATMLTRIDPGRIIQHRIEPSVVPVQELGSNLLWDQAAVQALVRDAFSPPGEAQEQAVIQVQNGAGVGGIAGRLTQTLQDERFITVEPGNADVAERSQIIDYGDHSATRERLSKVLGGMPVVEGSSPDAPPDVDIVVRLGQDYERYWQP